MVLLVKLFYKPLQGLRVQGFRGGRGKAPTWGGAPHKNRFAVAYLGKPKASGNFYGNTAKKRKF